MTTSAATLEAIAVDRTLDSPTRHLRLVEALAPLGPDAAHAEANTIEAHGWYLRTQPYADGRDVWLHAEAEMAANRCNCKAVAS